MTHGHWNGLRNGLQTDIETANLKEGTKGKKEESGKPDPFMPQSSSTNGEEGRPGNSNFDSMISEVINHLNQLAGTSYRPTTKATMGHVRARIAEGFTLENLMMVVGHNWEDWKDNPKMVKYFRPETLFGTKFESYLQNAKRNGNGTDHKPEVKDLGNGMVEVEGVRMERPTYEVRYGAKG